MRTDLEDGVQATAGDDLAGEDDNEGPPSVGVNVGLSLPDAVHERPLLRRNSISVPVTPALVPPAPGRRRRPRHRPFLLTPPPPRHSQASPAIELQQPRFPSRYIAARAVAGLPTAPSLIGRAAFFAAVGHANPRSRIGTGRRHGLSTERESSNDSRERKRSEKRCNAATRGSTLCRAWEREGERWPDIPLMVWALWWNSYGWWLRWYIAPNDPWIAR